MRATGSRRRVRPGLAVTTMTALLGSLTALAVPAAAAEGGTAPATSSQASASAAAAKVACTSKSTSHASIAAALARDIQAAHSGRSSTVAVWVDDPSAGITCSLNGTAHFDSASIVKVIILEALMRHAIDHGRPLTSTEASLAYGMITTSSNADATALWDELGYRYLQHFLGLAGMRQTVLGANGYWGLTQATAHDEMLLLGVLLTNNTILHPNSRAYGLNLMAHVISSQRWGTPAGAPRTVTVHVKNGWLPRATHGWRINSLGAFTWSKGWYTIVVLTMDNPTMSYGVTTVEDIARVIHHDLNPTVKAVIARSVPSPDWGTPDEVIPALPNVP